MHSLRDELMAIMMRELRGLGPDDPTEVLVRALAPVLARLVAQYGVRRTNELLARTAEETGLPLLGRVVVPSEFN